MDEMVNVLFLSDRVKNIIDGSVVTLNVNLINQKLIFLCSLLVVGLIFVAGSPILEG